MSPRLHGIAEYRFIDPRTIVDGKDQRGRVVLDLFTAETPMPAGAPPNTPTWAAAIEDLAERQEKYATWYEQHMRAHGHLLDRHSTVHMPIGDVPTARSPCPRCAEITADARDATRSETRILLAKIEVL